MPKNYRTAQGKNIDMAALIAKNEKTRAVGNMKVNARGDLIDGFNRVVVPATERASQTYAKTVGNKSANVVKKPNRVVEAPVVKEEVDLDDEWNELAEEVSKIKKQAK